MITKNDNIANVFEKFPSTRRVFIKNSMRCFGCEMMKFSTVEDCCKSHKVKDMEDFICALNKAIIFKADND
ncbi:MAG: DUF1858 domain-containing protein [Candidatus Delongbacteria bacterium]|nr:DUF1858 domain-containing protein [Candidatus Delongbacteria bacterium]